MTSENCIIDVKVLLTGELKSSRMHKNACTLESNFEYFFIHRSKKKLMYQRQRPRRNLYIAPEVCYLVYYCVVYYDGNMV